MVSLQTFVVLVNHPPSAGIMSYVVVPRMLCDFSAFQHSSESRGLNLQQTISYECHYFLSRAGVQLPEQKHQSGTWEEDHRESARSSLQCTLHDALPNCHRSSGPPKYLEIRRKKHVNNC